MDLIDSHAHLDFSRFDGDRDQVIERAWAQGVVGVINVGTDATTSRASIALAEARDFIYAAVGVHPHHAETASAGTLSLLRSLAQRPEVVAIGEIGLDYYRDYSPRRAQRQAFRAQLSLASQLGMPVVIHSRDAHDHVLDQLDDWEGTGVLHSYAAGLDQLERVVDIGFYVGISGPVTYAKAEELREVARAVPLDRLLIETDCPYLTPEPHRGKRNEPAYVRFVANEVAAARGLSLEAVASATTANARRLFGLPGSTVDGREAGTDRAAGTEAHQ